MKIRREINLQKLIYKRYFCTEVCDYFEPMKRFAIRCEMAKFRSFSDSKTNRIEDMDKLKTLT